MEYPKINSLYKREDVTLDPVTGKNLFSKSKKHKLVIGDYALEEFGLINSWQVFEKIDGTNIRITFKKEGILEDVRFDGRTNNAQIPTHLIKYLQDKFTIEKLSKYFEEDGTYILFGEGFGPKIQDGGNYRFDVSFILFDVFISPWWLNYESRLQIADYLSIEHVPFLGEMNESEILHYIRSKPKSTISVNKDYVMEGVVCRSEPLLCLRNGDPLKFKLKCVDL
jgi:ATP-dependent RNA circularization protein (DNA/RNA ligase family)